jgi:hypothetical protein
LVFSGLENTAILGRGQSNSSRIQFDGKREAQPFRSKVDGFVPLSGHRSAVLRADLELDRNDLREPKKTLKLQSRTPSLLQDCTSLPVFLVELRNPGSFLPQLGHHLVDEAQVHVLGGFAFGLGI